MSPSVTNWPGLAHVILYGQSLSCGFGGLPALSTTPEPIGLRFSGGVRPIDDFPRAYDTLEPLAETNSGYFGETPATAAARMFAKLVEAEEGIAADDLPFKLLFSTPGEPGKSIADLSVGTGNFERVKSDVFAGFLRGQDRAENYRLMAMGYVQGETDYERSTSRDDYLAGLRRLHAEMRAMARGMDPLAASFPLLVTQTTTHVLIGHETPDIALAQLALAEDDDVALVCVPYALPFWPHDLHLMATGYQWLGAYYGAALKRWLWDGVKPRHLRPAEALVEDGGVTLRFDTAGAPLAFDTDAVPPLPAMGFTLADGVGAEVAIGAVRLAGADRVRLELTGPAPDRLSIRYGWRGPGASGAGNLRDTAGDTLVFDFGGYTRPLHNWCPILEIAAR